MAVSANLISAAAGLVGALIGGTSTYLANRVQWRRESRRKAYAELIGAAYNVEAFIVEGLQDEAVGDGTDFSTGRADPRNEFYSELDSAILLAEWKTQNALHKWRELSERLDKFDNLAKSARTLLRTEWRERQKAFYDRAKDELGVKGRYSYRRALERCAFVAGILMLVYFAIYYVDPSSITFGTVRFTLVIATIVLLSFTFRASYRWRIAVEHMQGVVDLREINNVTELKQMLGRLSRIVDIWIIATAIALICSILAFGYETSGASRILILAGFCVLFIGAFLQVAISGDPIYKFIKNY